MEDKTTSKINLEAQPMRMTMFQGDTKEFSVAIPSLKKSREYLLNLFAKESARTHIVYRAYRYTASDIYAGRKGIRTQEVA